MTKSGENSDPSYTAEVEPTDEGFQIVFDMDDIQTLVEEQFSSFSAIQGFAHPGSRFSR